MMNTTHGRITEYLSRDHVRLHDLLARATASEIFGAEAFAEFREGLLRHIAIEEKILLPAVKRARGGESLSRAHQLRVEHGALTSLLVPTPDAGLCAEIISILSPHDAREEGSNGVYAECEGYLSSAESNQLTERALSMPKFRTMPHYDGPEVHRTAVSALASANRIKPSHR